MDKKQTNYVYTLIIISILFSSFQFLLLGSPDYSLIGKSDREKLIILNPEYYEILNFTEDKTEVGSILLFIDFTLFIIAQPFFYPFRISYNFEYENGTNDQELLKYLEKPLIDYANGRVTFIDYIVISKKPFHLSSNETLFTKLELDSFNYILKVNRSAL